MKITKKQRKYNLCLERQCESNPSGLSEAFRRSMDQGIDILVGTACYMGDVSGVPFVRIRG